MAALFIRTSASVRISKEVVHVCRSLFTTARMGVAVKFAAGASAGDPMERPVTIIGQVKNLQKINFDAVRAKLEPRVTEEVLYTNLPNQIICSE
jgi:hypothetical protein